MLELGGIDQFMGSPRIYEIFGKRVATERLARGLSQNELAQRVGLSRASVANIEAGRQRVLLHQVLEFAHVLGASSVGDFFTVDLRSDARHGPENQLQFNGSELTFDEAATLSRLVKSA